MAFSPGCCSQIDAELQRMHAYLATWTDETDPGASYKYGIWKV